MKGPEAGQWTLLPGPRSIDRKTCPSSYCPLRSFTQGPFLGTGSEDTTANIKRLSSSFKPRIFCLHVEQGRQGASTCSGTPFSVGCSAPLHTYLQASSGKSSESPGGLRGHCGPKKPSCTGANPGYTWQRYLISRTEELLVLLVCSLVCGSGMKVPDSSRLALGRFSFTNREARERPLQSPRGGERPCRDSGSSAALRARRWDCGAAAPSLEPLPAPHRRSQTHLLA